MAEGNSDNVLSFGRVVYVEPNNNITGTGKGTNFTFEPEDYSILVDLQVDVVDRFAYNGSGGKEQLQYTLEWDAKGTKTSMFKGTNGLLTTRAMDTTFHDINDNYNQEAIGINSIEIRYNSWNYPEITINFTDIRGASLMAAADYSHDYITDDINKAKYADNFANSFFSTFFKFPYPRYTLIVKGFYGRPVSYMLCVNDFKTRFNSQNGNFDVTVSFIGYMYGLLTDIPMRLLFAAPYSEYRGEEYWKQQTEGGHFIYEDTKQKMLTFLELDSAIKSLPENLKKLPNVLETLEKNKKLETKKQAIEEIRGYYNAFINQFDHKTNEKKGLAEFTTTGKSESGSEAVGREYIFLFAKCEDSNECPMLHDNNHVYIKREGKYKVITEYVPGFRGPGYYLYAECPYCNGTGTVKRSGDNITFNNVIEDNTDAKNILWKKVAEYNEMEENAENRLPYFSGINDETNSTTTLFGASVYNDGSYSNKFSDTDSIFSFGNVNSEDYEQIRTFLGSKGKDIATQISKDGSVAVCIICVDAFKKALNDGISKADLAIQQGNEDLKKKQEDAYTKLLGFKVSLKNIIDMALAHLDTFMECVYSCMDEIRRIERDFSDEKISLDESDVLGNADPVKNKSRVFLPPFFAFRKLNPKNDEYEDEWIGKDPRFSNRDRYVEIKLIDGLLNAALKGAEKASESAAILLGNRSTTEFGDQLSEKECLPTFVNDIVNRGNPYENVGVNNMEPLIAMFAFRSMLATVYSLDYPNIGNRFDAFNDSYKKEYFKVFGANEAESFSRTEAFKTFRKNFGGDDGTLEKITWDIFEKYITGKQDNLIIQSEKGHLYFSGLDTPLYKKTNETFGDNYILSYGNENDKKFAIPMNYTSPTQAVNIVKNIINWNSGTTETNGFGVSTDIAMPRVEVIGGDSQLEGDREIIERRFEELKKGNIQNVGIYFKSYDTWRKYFSGVPSVANRVPWFPSLALKDDLTELASITDDKNKIEGNIYNNPNGSVALRPMPERTSFSDFFINTKEGSNQAGLKGKQFSKDGYIEDTVVKEIFEGSPDNVTVYGLGCGEGSLFGSEFYAIQSYAGNWSYVAEKFPEYNFTQNDIVTFRKAFLFLHSLPTSEYGAFGNAVSTIIKRTYAPSITDIPLASALFIGALYFRERANGDADVSDKFINYAGGVDEYKTATSRQLITYKDKPSWVERWWKRNVSGVDMVIRRPLNPIGLKDSGEYLYLISTELQEEIDKLEKEKTSQQRDQKLRNYFDGISVKVDYEPFYCGFWNLKEITKTQFIKLFIDWARGDFATNIDKKLSIRKKDGTMFTPKDIENFKNVITEKVFNKNGVAGKNNLGITKGTSYSDYLKKTFNEDLFIYNSKLGVSDICNSIQTIFRKGTEPVNAINKILINGATVKVPFPRVLMTRDMFSPDWPEERYALRIDKDILKTGFESFKQKLTGIIGEKKKEEENDTSSGDSTPANVTDEVKLSLYETLKNLHDKWLVATNRNKYKFSMDERLYPEKRDKNHRPMSENFFYINSFYEDVGDEIMLNIEELPGQLHKVIHSVNDACSLYSFMYDISNQARTQLLALPVFNNMADPDYVREMFTPIPYDNLDFSEIYNETQYVFMYPEEASKHLDLEAGSRYENEKYKYQDDSFILVEEGGVPSQSGKPPKTFYEDKGMNVPVIGVTFAKQNQSFFKNVNVSMDNPKTTEVAINNTFLIAEKYNKGNTQITALGQDLFPIYSNYSYECSVEMMGCACIMPLMYFQLNNIPMFKGTYIIYNVSHSITPGNMTTSFTGQRLSRFRKKRNEKALAATPNDEAFRNGSGTYNEALGCYTECITASRHKLEHESDYAEMSRICGVDKDILRAVEYAENYYNGGFFKDGKTKMYYDPWMAKVYGGVTEESLIVSTQFTKEYIVKETYEENLARITEAIKSVGGNTEKASKISACTINGTFGIPGQAYSLCGAGSLSEFYTNLNNGFGAHGKYFATLLNSKPELKTALQNKDWNTFAKLYKGANGLTESGVYMPDDSANFANYSSLLKTGYDDASSAKPECVAKAETENKDYVYASGQEMHLVGSEFNPHAEESKAYAQAHPLDVRAAITVLNDNVHKVYMSGSCDKINPTAREKDGKGDYYFKSSWNRQKNVYLKDTPEHIAQPGRKPAGWSISLCATYVKCALAAGGYPYFSCNGGFCGPILEERGFEEIYRSGPGGETPDTPGFNNKWQTGDIMTIEQFVKPNGKTQEHGHIMMWNGTNWVSDFLQQTCKTYDSWKKPWDEGKYHVWRYRNIINK